MATATGPNIILDGLRLHYNFASEACYPGSGSTVFDLSGNKLHGTIVGGGTYTNDNLGSFNTNGTSQYIQTPPIDCPTQSRTVNMIYRFNSGQGSLWRVADWRERIFSTVIVIIPSSSTYYYVNAPVNDGNIHNICYSYSGTSLKTYRDGNLIDSITMDSSMSAAAFNFRFGNLSSGSSNYYSNLDYNHISFYDRQLSDDEVKQNFQALRYRFGL